MPFNQVSWSASKLGARLDWELALELVVDLEDFAAVNTINWSPFMAQFVSTSGLVLLAKRAKKSKELHKYNAITVISHRTIYSSWSVSRIPVPALAACFRWNSNRTFSKYSFLSDFFWFNCTSSLFFFCEGCQGSALECSAVSGGLSCAARGCQRVLGSAHVKSGRVSCHSMCWILCLCRYSSHF